MKTNPRMRIWREGNPSRLIATGDGSVVAYEGEWILVVVGKDLGECARQFCGMFKPEPSTDE